MAKQARMTLSSNTVQQRKVAKPDGLHDGPPKEEPTVVCFVSGLVVPERDAVQVRLGPGHRVWMLPEYCR
ncbi:MAG: hypothetical protein ACI9MR_003718 [Myxococcota bacterium]|jgi:hypothetical protein